MTISKVHFSSVRSDWATPRDFFARLDEEFHFTLDACATEQSACCPKFISADENAFFLDWPGIVFLNPPYGRHIGRWIAKAYHESERGSTIVCLLPSRTDTAWFHDLCAKGEIRFIRGRLYFDDSGARAPFPSMIVIFRPRGSMT